MSDETPPPAAPDVPPAPELPALPEVPSVPDVAPAPDVPAAPDVPVAPDVPPVPGLPPVPDAPDGPTAGAGPAARRSRRGLALGLAAALVAVVAGGGIGYAVLKHQDGTPSASPTATPWTPPTPTATKAFGAKSGGSHYGSLSLLLLPMPAQYSPGPDFQEFGNDAVLSGEQAEDLVKGTITTESKKQRKQIEKSIDALHIEGVGLRTYTERDGGLVVQMEIVQMKNKEAARAETKFFAEFTKALGIFRNGPKVKGHPHATCVLPPTEPGEKLDMMTCQATEGDLMVTMSASGPVPLEKAEAVELLSKQLDRIQDPGEAV